MLAISITLNTYIHLFQTTIILYFGHNRRIFSNCRTIVLPANAFDSKIKFLQELRGRFGSGILNLGGVVTASTLADYYTFLKGDVVSSSSTRYYKAIHLGFQGNGYWLLSKEVLYIIILFTFARPSSLHCVHKMNVQDQMLHPHNKRIQNGFNDGIYAKITECCAFYNG